MNHGVEADKELFDNLDRTIRREAEIAAELDAWVQAHNGQHPPERVVSDICEAAALRNRSGNGCVAILLCATVGMGAFVYLLGGVV